jgi:hypothetical protein
MVSSAISVDWVLASVPIARGTQHWMAHITGFVHSCR